jgi:hypothetical protein
MLKYKKIKTMRTNLISIKKIKIYLIVTLVNIGGLLLSCHNLNKSSEGYIKHQLSFDGRRMTFCLPEDYTDNFKAEEVDLNYLGLLHAKKYVFCSQKNKWNFFSFERLNEPIECNDSLDAYVKRMVYNQTHKKDNPVVPLTEKRIDKNEHVYYIIMIAYNSPLENEKHKKLKEQHSTYSEFIFLTYFDNIGYLCKLQSRERLFDYSYEKQRKIIESIIIE